MNTLELAQKTIDKSIIFIQMEDHFMQLKTSSEFPGVYVSLQAVLDERFNIILKVKITKGLHDVVCEEETGITTDEAINLWSCAKEKNTELQTTEKKELFDKREEFAENITTET